MEKRGTVGLITYMRTDSTRISDTAKAEAVTYIEDKYGKEYIATEIKQTKKLQMHRMRTKQYVQQVQCGHQMN